MGLTIGVLATRHIWSGIVEQNALAGPMRVFPDPATSGDGLRGMPADAIAEIINREVRALAAGREVSCVGIGFPGIIREGTIEECPNLQQVKGFHLASAISPPARVLNDSDAMAAGVAATRRQLEKVIRVWNLGDGIGFGRYPRAEGVWEAGHSVVTLDPRERYCGCGGVGHLEGIMGYRAMRLRFLDMEPDEVFSDARAGDARCAEFVRMWHRALAAATATSIHIDGPGRFYLLGPNADFVDLPTLNVDLHEMVTMSSLQGSTFEKIDGTYEVAVIGAGVHAARAGASAGGAG